MPVAMRWQWRRGSFLMNAHCPCPPVDCAVVWIGCAAQAFWELRPALCRERLPTHTLVRIKGMLGDNDESLESQRIADDESDWGSSSDEEPDDDGHGGNLLKLYDQGASVTEDGVPLPPPGHDAAGEADETKGDGADFAAVAPEGIGGQPAAGGDEDDDDDEDSDGSRGWSDDDDEPMVALHDTLHDERFSDESDSDDWDYSD